MINFDVPSPTPSSGEGGPEIEKLAEADYVYEVIESIDESFLHSIITTEFRRSLNDTDMMSRFIPLGDIQVASDYDRNTLGSYESGQITLYCDVLHKTSALDAEHYLLTHPFILGVSDNNNLPDKKELQDRFVNLEILHTIIHEELHALTDTGWNRLTELEKKESPDLDAK